LKNNIPIESFWKVAVEMLLSLKNPLHAICMLKITCECNYIEDEVWKSGA